MIKPLISVGKSDVRELRPDAEEFVHFKRAQNVAAAVVSPVGDGAHVLFVRAPAAYSPAIALEGGGAGAKVMCTTRRMPL